MIRSKSHDKGECANTAFVLIGGFWTVVIIVAAVVTIIAAIT